MIEYWIMNYDIKTTIFESKLKTKKIFFPQVYRTDFPKFMIDFFSTLEKFQSVEYIDTEKSNVK